jgi:nucleoid DNA-binding protein
MTTITKKELVERIAEQTQAKRSVVRHVIQLFLNEIVLELSRNNRLEFRDFGILKVCRRKARVAQNPKTLEKVIVPAKLSVKFKMGRLMKENSDIAALDGIDSVGYNSQLLK